ncbi:MAG: IS1096 element passenger TnpR family protein [Pyrinomonadaceae bacterium]
MTKSTAKKQAARTAESDRKLYTLDVYIMDGPMTESFLKKHKVVSRTIQIRGDQTLAELHRAIFDAFDREDEHMYEFQIGGEGPMDPKARRYVLPAGIHGGDKPAGGVKSTTIESLGLKVNDLFGYWFDFGDDWWHQVNVVAVEERAVRGKFPKVVKRVGKSPPQYADWDEDEE